MDLRLRHWRFVGVQMVALGGEHAVAHMACAKMSWVLGRALRQKKLPWGASLFALRRMWRARHRAFIDVHHPHHLLLTAALTWARQARFDDSGLFAPDDFGEDTCH